MALNTDRLRGYAKLCYLAYQPESRAIVAYKSIGWDAELLMQSSPIERVYVLKSPAEILFVICGSNDLGDWLCNLSARPNALMHPGYSYAAKRLTGPIRAIADDRSVKILGHSKGGAVAGALGYYLAGMNPEIISFGSPRIGNQKLADTYKSQYLRVVNPWDIVARLPLHCMGYRHCGSPIVWDEAAFVEGAEAWEEAQRAYPISLLIFRLIKSLMAHFSYWG
jgi:Lipase (class 3)